MSGRIFDEPKLIVKDRSSVGWNTMITVNREVVIEGIVALQEGLNPRLIEQKLQGFLVSARGKVPGRRVA